MFTTIGSLIRKPFEVIGVINPRWDETTEEELNLVKRLEEKLREETLAYKEHKGFVTQISHSAIELDHKWVYPLDVKDSFQVGDRVSFKVYKTLNNVVLKDVVLLTEKLKYVSKSVSGTIVRVDGNKYEMSNGLKFDLSSIRSEFLPMLHDLVTAEGDYPKDKDDDAAFDLDYTFLIVKRVIPNSTKLVTGFVTSWNSLSGTGVIGNHVLFHKNVCDQYEPKQDDSVVCSAIEGHYDDNFSWRAESVTLNKMPEYRPEYSIVITPIPKFNLTLGERKTVDICLSNQKNDACSILSYKCYVKDTEIDSSGPNIKVIPPRTSITWPVEVFGSKLGPNKIIAKWKLTSGRRPFVVSSSIFYITVNQYEKGTENNEVSPNNKKSLFFPGQSRVKKPTFIKVQLKPYLVPEAIRDVFDRSEQYEKMIDIQIALQHVVPSLSQQLSETNYGEWMHTMLFLEELADVKKYEQLHLQDYLYRNKEFIVFKFPLDSEYSKIVCGDTILVSKPWEPDVVFEGKIWEISTSQLFCKFNAAFEGSMREGALYLIHFKMNRTPYRRLHQGVDIVLNSVGKHWLFPPVSFIGDEESDENALKNGPEFNFVNKQLNNEQKCAVKQIVLKQNLPHPYIIYGPPGTGKTMTVIEAILQLYMREPDCRILIAAPTNSAVDTLGVRMLGFDCVKKEEVVRLSGFNAYSQGLIATQLMDISFVPNLADPSSAPPCQKKDEVPTLYLSDLGRHKITLGTLTTLSILNCGGLAKGFFTHIIIDEAGQCHEPNSLLPVALIDPLVTQMVFAGDPMQLGPTISSQLAKQYNFQISLLARFSSSYLYRKKQNAFESTCGYNPKLITKLILNYRSLPKIVDLISNLFYDADLMPTISYCSREADVLKKIEIQDHALGSNLDSNIFINVDSKDEQMDGNSSWFNNGEIIQVLNVLNSLYSKGVSPDDIGVITPYSLQVRKIYELLDSLNIFSPKVASVEEFQGQERDIIIMSLVRNNCGISKKLSPFLTDSQRINVALSRAKVLNVLIGNRRTLMVSPMWAKIISTCHIINFIEKSV